MPIPYFYGYEDVLACDLNSENGALRFLTTSGHQYITAGSWYPQNNVTSLGKAGNRWTQLFAMTDSISTSDERLKEDIHNIPDAILDAWGDVQWHQYQFIDAVANKGAEEARIHSGLIAQRIKSIFEEHGIDATKFGLLCYDSWDGKQATFKYVKKLIAEAVYDEDGNVLVPEEWIEQEIEISPSVEAGDIWSVRYSEAFAVEAAYQRRRADRIEARIAALEAKLGII